MLFCFTARSLQEKYTVCWIPAVFSAGEIPQCNIHLLRHFAMRKIQFSVVDEEAPPKLTISKFTSGGKSRNLCWRLLGGHLMVGKVGGDTIVESLFFLIFLVFGFRVCLWNQMGNRRVKRRRGDNLWHKRKASHISGLHVADSLWSLAFQQTNYFDARRHQGFKRRNPTTSQSTKIPYFGFRNLSQKRYLEQEIHGWYDNTRIVSYSTSEYESWINGEISKFQ